MIHHLSIAANDPQRVGTVFAELLGGSCFPFPPNPGSYFALARDNHGTGVEVYPADSVLQPNGAAGADFVRTGRDAGFGAVHFALSVPLAVADVQAIADREGWACHVCSRGNFDVVEVWIENTLMVEVLPPDFAARYLDFAGRIGHADSPLAVLESHEPSVGASRAG